MITTVLSAGTMGGVDVATHLAVAAEAGFAAVSLRPAAIESWITGGRSLRELRTRLGDHGLALAEVDPLTGWSGGTVPAAARRTLDLAGELGARAVSALVLPEEPAAQEPMTAGFAALCSEAADRQLLVQLEPFAWSPVRSLATAGTIAAGPANGGVLVDTWHVARAGEGTDELTALGPELTLAFQVSDGPAIPAVGDLATECRQHRQWPGTGALEPGRLVQAIVARGWSGPVGVEVFGSAADAPADRAHEAHRSLIELLRAMAEPA